MSFKVLQTGFLTTVQDLGRFGYKKYGLNQSGAMDIQAFCWGNFLLDNKPDCASLEITLSGCQLLATKETSIVLTGANLNFCINQKPQPLWQIIKIHLGDILSWNKITNGVRAYLAVKGGIQTKVYFGSRSVNTREQIGNKISRGQRINYIENQQDLAFRQVPFRFIPKYQNSINLRLISGFQFNKFSQKLVDNFFSENWLISNACDRSGCRLEGNLVAMDNHTMISEGTSVGSVQITSAGQPIILLNDAPTIGGYYKIATVFSLDLAKLAQAMPGTKVTFSLIDIETAQQERLKFNQFFNIND